MDAYGTIKTQPLAVFVTPVTGGWRCSLIETKAHPAHTEATDPQGDKWAPKGVVYGVLFFIFF